MAAMYSSLEKYWDAMERLREMQSAPVASGWRPVSIHDFRLNDHPMRWEKILGKNLEKDGDSEANN